MAYVLLLLYMFTANQMTWSTAATCSEIPIYASPGFSYRRKSMYDAWSEHQDIFPNVQWLQFVLTESKDLVMQTRPR